MSSKDACCVPQQWLCARPRTRVEGALETRGSDVEDARGRRGRVTGGERRVRGYDERGDGEGSGNCRGG
jgi:hypothetical protein